MISSLTYLTFLSNYEWCLFKYQIYFLTDISDGTFRDAVTTFMKLHHLPSLTIYLKESSNFRHTNHSFQKQSSYTMKDKRWGKSFVYLKRLGRGSYRMSARKPPTIPSFWFRKWSTVTNKVVWSLRFVMKTTRSIHFLTSLNNEFYLATQDILN